MNRAELIAAALGDSHREDYATKMENGIPITSRFVTEAEALIASRLESYGLEVTLSDTDRGDDFTTPVYALPDRLRLVRHVFKVGQTVPLDAVDETTIGLYSSAKEIVAYCVRVAHLIFAGLPGEGTEFRLHYFGLPAPLVNDTDTNKLLNDYPQLYKEAMQVYIYKRAKDFESAQVAQQSALGLIDEINRQVKKQLGGARSSNPYNVSFRSSY